MSPENVIFIFICIVVVAFVVALLIILKQSRKKVESHSERIKQIKKINEEIKFHNLKDSFTITKHYDNKSNFIKVEPQYIMTACLQNNMAYFIDYVRKIKENREKLANYNYEYAQIKSTITKEECKRIQVAYFLYKYFEEKICKKLKNNPVTTCVIVVKLTYSSPQRRVNLSKEGVFNFSQLEVSLNSISRSRLDKETKEQLTKVERGEMSDSLRYDILKRDNFKCVICGASSNEGARLHVDHIVPVSKGGKTVPSNLRTLCERCNIGKSDKIEFIPASEMREERQRRCPVCNGRLVVRTSEYGQFYGCENYPRCRHTEKLRQ